MKLMLVILLFIINIYPKTLELIHADYNRNEMIDGSIITYLYGNVDFKYGKIKIISDTTVWQRGAGILDVKGNVKIDRPTQHLECDSLKFFSKKKLFELRDNTLMTDSSHKVTVTSKEADYYSDLDSLELRGQPKVFFWNDESPEDSIVIRGEPMHYLGDSGIARVKDNFSVNGNNLDATAHTGFYNREAGKGHVYGNAILNYHLSTIKGNNIWVYFTDQVADSFTVVEGIPTGITRDTSNGDTTVNILTGDSLHFTLDTTRIERISSVKDAKLEQFPPLRDDNSSDILWGDIIISNMNEDGTGTAFSYGNARSVYRSDSTMDNEVSSDTLSLIYNKHGVQKITLTGGVQGVILSK